MNLLQRFDAILGSNQSLNFDDGTIDHTSYLDPETGLLIQKPLKVTPEQVRQRDIRDLRRELEGVEHRLARLDDPIPPWQVDVPSSEILERTRTILLEARTVVRAELKRLKA